jgi:hypothetical protein
MGKTLNESMGKFYIQENKLVNSTGKEYDLAKIRQEKELNEANKLLLEAEKTKQEEINKKIEKLELLPLGVKIIIQAYPQNPYRKVMEGNIIVDYSGEFLNPESGEKDKLKELVGCAKIIEVGSDCKWLKPGDDIYYDTRTTYPVPFMSMGYLLTTEPQVLCVINEGLKERFKMN